MFIVEERCHAHTTAAWLLLVVLGHCRNGTCAKSSQQYLLLCSTWHKHYVHACADCWQLSHGVLLLLTSSGGTLWAGALTNTIRLRCAGAARGGRCACCCLRCCPLGREEALLELQRLAFGTAAPCCCCSIVARGLIFVTRFYQSRRLIGFR
jgi:hypothetical protein